MARNPDVEIPAPFITISRVGQLISELQYLAISASICFLLPIFSSYLLTRSVLKNPNEPWYDRARRLWPARVNLSAFALFLPIIAVLGPILKFRHVEILLHPILYWFIGYFALLNGAFICQRWIASLTYSYKDFWRRWATEQTILGAPLIVAIISLIASKDNWDRQATIQFIIVFFLFTIHACGGALKIFERAGAVVPADDKLDATLASLAAQAGLQKPKGFILQLLSANAFAFPVTHTIGIGDRIVASLPHDSVVAICRHELAHLTESRWVLAARFVYFPFLLLLSVTRPFIGTFGAITWVSAMIISLILITSLKKLWQKMETRADTHAANGDSEEKEYSRALEKLHELNLIPAVLRKSNTHPDLYDRLVNVGATPDYPRPAPPNQVASGVLLVISLSLATFLSIRQAFVPS